MKPTNNAATTQINPIPAQIREGVPSSCAKARLRIDLVEVPFSLRSAPDPHKWQNREPKNSSFPQLSQRLARSRLGRSGFQNSFCSRSSLPAEGTLNTCAISVCLSTRFSNPCSKVDDSQRQHEV